MFIPLQFLFVVSLGSLLLYLGTHYLREQQYVKGWLLFLVGIAALLWWPYVFLDEASRTRTDSEGTYIIGQ